MMCDAAAANDGDNDDNDDDKDDDDDDDDDDNDDHDHDHDYDGARHSLAHGACTPAQETAGVAALRACILGLQVTPDTQITQRPSSNLVNTNNMSGPHKPWICVWGCSSLSRKLLMF